jgi:LysM repeat protein
MIDSKHSKPGSKIPPRTDVTERLGSVPPPSGETIAPGTVPPASEPPASLGRSRRVPLPPPEEPEPKRALIWGALALIALIAGGIIWFSLSPEEEAKQTPVVEGTDEIATPPAETSEAPPGTEPSAPAPEGAGVAETETPPPALEPSEREEMPAGQLLDKEVEKGETPEAPVAGTEETPEPPAATAPEVATEEPPVEPSEPPTAPAAEEAPPESPDLAATTPKAPPSPAAEEPAPAVETPAATGAPGTYTIAPGDTLGEIASRLYGDATRWRVIARANPGLNPNRLLVGQVIKLPAAKQTGAAKQTAD